MSDHYHVLPLSLIHINVDPVALRVGRLALHWYGVMYALAFAAGFRYAVLPHLLPRGVDRARCERMLVTVIVAGLVGARLYYDVQQPAGAFIDHPLDIIAVWQGGMDFFGAIFAATAAILVVAWREKYNVWLLLDAGALFAVVGQPIGRIGNIINGDILGAPSSLPWATAYDNPHALLQAGYLRGAAYQPAGAYEALITIAIGIALFALRRRLPRDGALFIAYFASYAISQFLIFYVRQSEPTVAWGLKQSQWTCLSMLVLGVPALLVLWRRRSGGTPPELNRPGDANPHPGIELDDMATTTTTSTPGAGHPPAPR